MNIHRLTDESDWAAINPERYNKAQQIAARTSGIITPGNIITLLGFLLVLYGLAAILQQHIAIGLVALIIGRLFDILDGIAAEATKTKNSIGEVFDATIDKISTVLTVAVSFFIQPTEWPVLLLLLAPHIIISFIVLQKRQRGKKLHPTRTGKISMATAWVAILGIIAFSLIPDVWHDTFVTLIYAILFISSGLGFYAALQYLQEKSK